MIDKLIETIEDEIIERLDIKREDINVIATGGFSELISQSSKYIETIEPDLML